MPNRDVIDDLERWEINMRRGMLEMFVLSIINEKEHTYGWAIVNDLKEKTADQFILEEGTLYPLLHRMEKRGFIEGWVQDTNSRLRRKYYRLTDYGKIILTQMLEKWERLVKMGTFILGNDFLNVSPSKKKSGNSGYCPNCGSKQFNHAARFCQDCGINLQT
jgi:PadR family transcriptional regulator PadR